MKSQRRKVVVFTELQNRLLKVMYIYLHNAMLTLKKNSVKGP